MPGAVQVFSGISKKGKSLSMWLKEGEKSLAQKARPEGYAFGGSGFPLCSPPLAAAAACHHAAAVCRLLRLFAIMLRLLAVVLRLLTIVLAVFRRRFTLMLRAFFWRRRRVVGSESP
jgi:hypothetical protein